MNYIDFLASKQLRAEESGFELDPATINPAAFDYQRDIISWACKKGKCAILTGCGSGKTMMQLEWCQAVHEHKQPCKYLSDDDQEICCNADCPCVADFCPVTYWPEICKYRVEDDLKPCPFCGRTGSIEVDKYKDSGVWWYFVTDTECLACGPVCSTRLEAVGAWNRRG